MAVKELGQITDEIIDNWPKQYEQRLEVLYCKKCSGQIRQTTCFVSIHIKEFEPKHTGSGKVARLNFPFCPKCDGDIEYATACYHVPLWVFPLRLPRVELIG